LGSPRYRGLSPGAIVVGLLQVLREKSVEKSGSSSQIATSGQLRSSFRHDYFLGLLCSISMNVFEFGALGIEGCMLETLSMECCKVSIIFNSNATRRASACMRLCHFFFLYLKLA
jgi:hypothetical protein